MRMKTKMMPESVVSKDELRAGICHAYFDAEKGRVYASDGTVATSLPVEVESGDESGFLSADALGAARKFATKSKHTELTISPKAASLLTVPATFVRPQGTPAPYKSIYDSLPTKPTYEVCLDAKKLIDLVASFGNGKDTQVVLTFGRDMDPIKVTPRVNDGSIGIIMPCRK